MTFIKPIQWSPLTVLFGAALLYGCASSAPEPGQTPTPAATPLTGMVGRQVVVLPAQLISTAAVPGAWDLRPDQVSLLPILDQEVEDAFRKRGVRSNWTFAREIIESARRNAGLAGNPVGLPVAGIRRVRAGDTPLPEPLASDIRGLVSLTNARYVIMPIETRVEITSEHRKGTLNLLLIDSRTARVLWVGDVQGQAERDPVIVSETMSPYGFRLLSRELAGLFADMVISQ